MLQNSCEPRIIILHKAGYKLIEEVASHLTHYVRMWNRRSREFITHTVTEFLFLHFLLTHHPSLVVLFERNIFYFHLFPLSFVHCHIAGYSIGLASCIHPITDWHLQVCTLPAPLQRECIHPVQYTITLN